MKISTKKISGYYDITLNNNAGAELTLCSLGASIRSVKVPDRDGVLRYVTLSPADEELFKIKHYGKTVGRTAGRIENATFTVDGKTAVLEKNNHGCDNLHGGKAGWHAVVFEYKTVTHESFTDTVFTYHSPDGEGGYFGDVDAKVTYRLYENENRFSVLFDCESSEKTLINLTNHVYWNMSGDLRESGKEQVLYINAPEYGHLDARLIVREIRKVPPEMDFTTPHKIGDYVYCENVQRYTHGYDHPYFLAARGLNNVAGSLYSQLSGIKLEVRTTYPCVVFYANSCPTQGMKLYGGGEDEQYLAACLECQYHPDGIHASPDDCGMTSPGKPYHEEIDFKFTITK